MKEILFSKYSGERSPQFAIRTSIVWDGKEKWVEKVPLTKEATGHIEKLADLFVKIQEIYRGTRLRPCPVTVENGIAKFEFIEGTSLHDKLGALVSANDEEGIVLFCKKYVSLIKSRNDIKPFEKTPEFLRIFGDLSLPDGLTGTAFSNIDMTFDNMIEKESGEIILLDYEWCFDFPIPLEYNAYRALFYSFEKWGMTDFLNTRICPILGIDEMLFSIIWEMEKGFSAYVQRGTKSELIWWDYNSILKRSYDWQEELNWQREELIRENEEAKQALIQVHHKEKQELFQQYERTKQVLIEKHEEEKQALIQQYKEEKQKIIQHNNEEKRFLVLRHEEEKQILAQEYEALNQQLKHYQEHYHAAIAQREGLKQELAQVQYAYADISNAFFWKITKPARAMTDALKVLLKKNRYTYLFCRGLRCLKQNGFSYTLDKVLQYRN